MSEQKIVLTLEEIKAEGDIFFPIARERAMDKKMKELEEAKEKKKKSRKKSAK